MNTALLNHAPRDASGLVPALVITALLAFTLGYALPQPDPTTPSISAQEDWHGNVRRSNWR